MTVSIDPEFHALIPPLTAAEREQLERNLLQDGCLDPLITWQGVLLDGHNRHEICKAHSLPFGVKEVTLPDRDAAREWIILHQFGRRHLQPYQRAELALVLEPLLAAQARERMESGRNQYSPGATLHEGSGRTTEALGKLAGLGARTIDKAREIRDRAPEPVKAQLRTGEITINRAYLELRRVTAEAKPVPEFVAGTFGVLYADPPWRYDFSADTSDRIETHYPTMDLAAICSLPVEDIAAEHCVLFLWATSPKLPEALQVVNAWGFTYRTCMVWVKDSIGLGYYARQRHELLLIATKGKPGVPPPPARPDSVIEAPRGAHSAKPAGVYGLIEAMYPNAPKVELFSRGQRPGWTVWGNDVA